jgi:hypothetical protein
MLKLGNDQEDKAIFMLEREFNLKLEHKNNNYKYDMLMNNAIKYEVKFDRKVYITNNFFLEYSIYFLDDKRKQLSGINTTEAFYYILIALNEDKLEYYIIEKNEILNYIKTNIVKHASTYNKFNNSYSNGYLISLEIIKHMSSYVIIEPYNK